jgi:hypothetical protein
VSYNDNTTDAVFSKSALALILGHSRVGHVKIGLDGNHLLIVTCSVEEPMAKTLELPADKRATTAIRKVPLDVIGRKLGVQRGVSYEGEVLMKDRDTFRAELQKKIKQS